MPPTSAHHQLSGITPENISQKLFQLAVNEELSRSSPTQVLRKPISDGDVSDCLSRMSAVTLIDEAPHDQRARAKISLDPPQPEPKFWMKWQQYETLNVAILLLFLPLGVSMLAQQVVDHQPRIQTSYQASDGLAGEQSDGSVEQTQVKIAPDS